MQIDSKNSRWSALTKFLHWSIAVALAVEIPVGMLMSSTFAASFRDEDIRRIHDFSAQLHHTLGLLITLAALVWLWNRYQMGRPAHLGTSAWQTLASRLAHVLLFILLLAIPWSGWTALSSLADSQAYGPTRMWFFGSDQILPRIWEALPPEDPTGYSRFAKLHRLLLWIGCGVLTVHVVAAMWHHWVNRDDVLRRLWPLAQLRDSDSGQTEANNAGESKD